MIQWFNDIMIQLFNAEMNVEAEPVEAELAPKMKNKLVLISVICG